MTTTYTNINKPSQNSYIPFNPAGKEQYDQASIAYDDVSVFYDGVNESMYTNISKPSTTIVGLVDSYSEKNQNASPSMPNFLGIQYTDIGQTFVPAVDASLTSCVFYLNKNGTPTGTLNMTAKLYATSAGLPTGSALATSTALTANNLTTSLALTTFTFPIAYSMTPGTTYAIIIEYTTGGASNNSIAVGVDTSSPTHSGGSVYSINSGSSWTTNTYDVCFYVYANVSPYTKISKP